MRIARQERYRKSIRQNIGFIKWLVVFFHLQKFWNDDRMFRSRIVSAWEYNPEKIPFIVEYFKKSDFDAKMIIDRLEKNSKSKLNKILDYILFVGLMVVAFSFLAGIVIVMDLNGQRMVLGDVKTLDTLTLGAFMVVLILFAGIYFVFKLIFGNISEMKRLHYEQDKLYEEYFEKGGYKFEQK